MYEALVGIVSVVVQLFAIMNPIGAIPAFITLTSDMSHVERRSVAKRSSLVILALMLLFTLGGTWILQGFHISIAGLQLGGGVLLMVIAVEMLGGLPRSRSVEAEDVAIVPVATPLIVGPGTITTLILLTASYNVILVVVGSMLAVALTALILYYSAELSRLAGRNIVNAFGRFMSLIIAAVAADMILRALGTIF